MKARITFNEIWKIDNKVRLLAGGMLADGIVLLVLATLIGFIIAM